MQTPSVRAKLGMASFVRRKFLRQSLNTTTRVAQQTQTVLPFPMGFWSLAVIAGGLEPAKGSLYSKLRRHKGKVHATSANDDTQNIGYGP